MSLLRSVGKAVSGTFFAIFLGLALTTMGLVNLTTQETLKPLVSDVASQQLSSSISQEELSQVLDQLKQECQGRSEIPAPLQGVDFTIKCSDVASATPQDIPRILATAIVDQAAAKTYTCEPLQCLQTLQGVDKLFYIFSSEFNSFLRGILTMLWVATAVTGIGYFFALQGIASRLKGFGLTFVAIGVPYFIINYAIGGIVSGLLPSEAASVVPAITNVLGTVSNNLLYIFIIGVPLLVAGFIVDWKKARKKK